ncbi:hypothetical protein chiPu_0027992 [Chiloscyllium punctatum]|uniref:Uncharacterized protein n=1 Tax=Chiloscyllium punctatum TaxID=137246 RepID=A0A401TMH0_CHIPU|nr:hypothetical protein [Chiloscyllium punctatum]
MDDPDGDLGSRQGCRRTDQRGVEAAARRSVVRDHAVKVARAEGVAASRALPGRCARGPPVADRQDPQASGGPRRAAQGVQENRVRGIQRARIGRVHGQACDAHQSPGKGVPDRSDGFRDLRRRATLGRRQRRFENSNALKNGRSERI